MNKEIDFKKEAYESMNEGFGRSLPNDVVARAGTIVVGLVFNLPYAKEYKENHFITHKGISHSYNKEYNLTLKSFAEIFHYGMAYGIVMAVGSNIDSPVVVGDKIMLRSLPQDTFIYGGKVFHFIREVDIALIVKANNKDLERNNGV